jgi:hypothetical protein
MLDAVEGWRDPPRLWEGVGRDGGVTESRVETSDVQQRAKGTTGRGCLRET